ncbi:MAG TPA: ComEA family DNA-binding protein, partial [Rhodanobacteraceae bacterium]|nr:ComEA family DNA-binding protein [Rhodanobacteraceae bacterium]
VSAGLSEMPDSAALPVRTPRPASAGRPALGSAPCCCNAMSQETLKKRRERRPLIQSFRSGTRLHHPKETVMIRKSLIALLLTLACALPAFGATPVDINHADATTIANSLDGIGLSKANAIVAWRNAHGAFKSVDDLRQVKGIGDGTLARNRDAIRLSGGSAVAANGKPAKATRHAKGAHPRKQ